MTALYLAAVPIIRDSMYLTLIFKIRVNLSYGTTGYDTMTSPYITADYMTAVCTDAVFWLQCLHFIRQNVLDFNFHDRM